MNKIIIIGFLLLIAFSVSSTAIVPKDDLDKGFNPLCSYMMDLASVGKVMPSFLPFKNEVFNVYDLDGNSVGHVSIEDGSITESNCDLSDDSTYSVFVRDDVVIDNIKNSEKPAKAYKEARKSGDIRVEGSGFGKRMKIGFINFFASIASWF